jgi:UrcA family protein
MTNFTAKFAGAASLVLAAMPMAVVATGARAEAVTVAIADIDTSTSSGRAAFEARVEQAAQAFCKDKGVSWTRIADDRACKAGVRIEMHEKLAQARPIQPQAFAAR